MTKEIAQIIGVSLVIIAGMAFGIVTMVKGILSALLGLCIIAACVMGLFLFLYLIIIVWEGIGDFWDTYMS